LKIKVKDESLKQKA